MHLDLIASLKCPNCKLFSLTREKEQILCNSCDFTNKINVPLRYLQNSYHDNWALQWNEFSEVQLDSFNKTTLSLDRLLLQSNVGKVFFKNKRVLEVGSGNGRFTEILLSLGASVVTVDYTSAIDANLKNNISKGNVIFLQADLFQLPIKKNSFDIVICYGVIQHTGNNEKAINELMKYNNEEGIISIDTYSNELKYYNPFIYLIRPFFSKLKKTHKQKLKIVERFINFIFPLQLWILKKLHNKKGLFKYLRFIINRSPNSVYGINLYLDNKISKNLAYKWSIMDTFDAWAGKHDDPISKKKWKEILNYFAKKNNFKIIKISESGQGNFAVLKKLLK